MKILEIIFWLSIFLIVHSYLVFPIVVFLFARKNNISQKIYSIEKCPKVTILMAVHNEESVIEEKVASIFNTPFPQDKICLLIGSDASTDRTNELVDTMTQKNPNVKFFPFNQRQGKANIINQLADKTEDGIIILTDANVMFDENTIYGMVKYFADPSIGLVDTHMVNKGLKKSGISIQEKAYISREVKIKNQESRAWGTMMGPFGGCFAMRKELFSPVPTTYLVDDFYLNMKVLEQGKKAVNSLDAKVYEDVSSDLKEEFRRKVRIATGNFQNLVHFSALLKGIFGLGGRVGVVNSFGLAFSFLSHKVLRWLGPFFIIIGLIANAFLLENQFYAILFGLYLFTFFVPITDFILKKINIHIILLRFITHFYSMNLALFIGFFKYLKGVNSNVWQPTKRNQ